MLPTRCDVKWLHCCRTHVKMASNHPKQTEPGKRCTDAKLLGCHSHRMASQPAGIRQPTAMMLLVKRYAGRSEVIGTQVRFYPHICTEKTRTLGHGA